MELLLLFVLIEQPLSEEELCQLEEGEASHPIAKATEGGASSSPHGSPGILIRGRVQGEERCF